MNHITLICLKAVRWSGWLLLPLVLGFLVTGYLVSGALRGMNEQSALALHKLLHLPLIALMLVHVLPAFYLALQRWGWTKHEKRPNN